MKKLRLTLPFLAATLGCAVLWLSPSAVSASTNFDPFARPATKSILPFHTAQAEAAPDSTVPAAKPMPALVVPASEAPLHTTEAAPKAETKAGPSNQQACTHDDQCPTGTICEDGSCQAFERPIDVLLYRKSGRSTWVLPFYFSNRGNPGHRVLAPLYFHFWSPESHTQIVAPFYWRVEDRLKQRVVTVVGLYSHTAQPDARSWALWPVFYLSTKFGWAAPPLVSFKVGDPDKGKAFGMWFLLYFWTRSPESKFDLLFPFAISTRSKNSAFTYAVPLNFYWRTKDDQNLLSIPFFYRNVTPTGGTLASLLGYASVENKATTGAFLWLYWYGRSQASNYDVLFPLLWSFRSPGASTTIVPPLLFHFRSKETSTGTFAFFAWWSSDQKAGSNWQLVLPLYFRKSNDHGARAFHLWPTGTYSRDDKAGSRYLTMLVPPLAYWRDKTGEIDYELIYYHHHDIPADAHTTILGPYYHRDDPAGTTNALFPLFWHFRDSATGATAHALLPFYFRRNSPDEKLTAAGIFPLWFYHRSFTDGGSSTGLFPFAFFGSRKENSHAIVFPLFWRFRKADAVSSLFFPLYYAASDKSSATTMVFPLLYFAGRDDQGSYRYQFPFYWNLVDQRSHTETTITPVYFSHTDTKGYASGIPPIFFWGGGGQRRHFALFPLFWRFRDDAKDRTTTVVANYLHRTEGGETTDAFFPLFHYRRGAKPGASDETSLTVFPLFHYRRDASTTLFVSPVTAWMRTAEKQAGFAGPYFWYRNQSFAVRGIPLLYLDHTQLDTGERTRTFGPYVALDGPGHEARALVPLWASYKNQQEQGTYVFPTFFRLRKNDGYRLDTFFPFLWLSRSPDSHTTVVGSYFTHHSPGSSSSGLLPFYLSAHTPKRDLFVTPLFLSHTDRPSGDRHIVSWLYYQSDRGNDMFRTVLPLWYQSRSENKSWAVGFPLFWHFADKTAHTSTTVAGPLFWARAGSERTRGLLSAWYSRDEQNSSASNAILPIFYERHSPRSQTLLTIPFGYKSSPDTRWWYAAGGLLLSRDTASSSQNFLVPLWFYHRDKTTDTRTLVIPPLLHYSHTSPERSLSSWLLLLWHRSSITSSATVGLPLVYDFHSYHQSRFTMVLPLFFRYRNEVIGTSTTVAPLFFRYSSPTDSTTIAFPLLWRFWSEERSTTVVFPFYIGVKRPTSDTTYVFPNIYYRKGRGSETGTSHLFVFPFWESEIKRPGDYMWEALLGVVGWERIGRNRFLKLLFIPFELEAAPAAKTAWYGKPPARTRERVARGLDIKSW
jgi:hypothetical protein